jgi:hypothetical protein
MHDNMYVKLGEYVFDCLRGPAFWKTVKKTFGFGRRRGIVGTVLENKGVTGILTWEGREQNRPWVLGTSFQ